jgi:vacuolar-type H+-ATPase subunit E/Vma4
VSEDLQTLIDSVRQEAVVAANAESAAILAAAQETADAMIAEAQRAAAAHLAVVEASAKNLELAGLDAVRRAARDARLTVAQGIRGVLDVALRKRMAEALDTEFLQSLIERLVGQWQPGVLPQELKVALSAADLERLEAGYLSGLEDAHVTLESLPMLNAGLRISQTGEDVFFDFSDAALTDLLTQHLSRRFASVIAEGES